MKKKTIEGQVQPVVRRCKPNMQVENGFWDIPIEERAARMEVACDRGGMISFWDLSPEERGRAYDD